MDPDCLTILRHRRQRRPLDVVDPDARSRNRLCGDGESAAIRGQANAEAIRPRRGRKACDGSMPIHGDQFGIRVVHDRTPDPGQRAAGRDRELAGPGGVGVSRDCQCLRHRVEHGHRVGQRLEPIGSEGDGHELAPAQEHEMTRGKVARIGGVGEQPLARARRQGLRNHLLVAPRPQLSLRGEEEHLSARQQRREDVRDLPVSQGCDGPCRAFGRNDPDPAVPLFGEVQVPCVVPRHASWQSHVGRQVHDRAAAKRDFSDPLGLSRRRGGRPERHPTAVG